MTKFIEFSGKTEEEAISNALSELKLDRDEVSIEIIERAKSGFLGLGSSPAVIRVHYQVKDSVTDKAENFIQGLLSHMGVTAAIEIKERENGGLMVNLSGDNMGIIIGRRGETLDAIQHLTNYSVNKGAQNRVHISVDAENYRSKREDSLVRLARKIAGKVIKYRKSMTLEPMNSYERHVIHTALQDFGGVTTSSTGTEPNRRVVISFSSSKSSAQPASREWS